MAQKLGPLGRDTIVLFDPVLVESDRVDLEMFLANFIRREGLFRFRINPQSVQISKSKLTQTVLTHAGYERAYFGNDLTRLSYSGSTGRLWLPQEFQNSMFVDIRLSPVWQKFVQFEVWFEQMNRDVMLLDHRGTLYRGAQTQFSYTERADDPFQIQYQFNFEAYTDELYGERLGEAIKRLGREDYLSKDYVAQMAYSAFTKALGQASFVDKVTLIRHKVGAKISEIV